MGKITETNRKRKIIGYMKTAITVIISWIVLGMVIIVPLYGRTLHEYRTCRAEITAAEAKLDGAKADEQELLANKAQIKTLNDEISLIKKDVFESAATLEKQIKSGVSKAKICYITIDDGPYYRGKSFLEIFDKYDVFATFFLCNANGNKLPDHPEYTAASMYPEYLKYGHTIGNHTFSHNYGRGGVYKNANSFMSQIKKQDDFIRKYTNDYECRIVRFPGGTSTAGKNYKKIAAALREEGYGWVDWTVDIGDSGYNRLTPRQMINRIKRAAKKQDVMIILCHEWSKDTQKALPNIIRYLKKQGYIFMPMYYDSPSVKK